VIKIADSGHEIVAIKGGLLIRTEKKSNFLYFNTTEFLKSKLIKEIPQA
jgi:hypothetical protein